MVSSLVLSIKSPLFSQKAPPIFARLVPFSAVAAANMVNIPFMRNKEITDGLPVYDANNNLIGNSQKAAVTGISMVVVSRIGMATPGMSEFLAN